MSVHSHVFGADNCPVHDWPLVDANSDAVVKSTKVQRLEPGQSVLAWRPGSKSGDLRDAEIKNVVTTDGAVNKVQVRFFQAEDNESNIVKWLTKDMIHVKEHPLRVGQRVRASDILRENLERATIERITADHQGFVVNVQVRFKKDRSVIKLGVNQIRVPHSHGV